MGIRLLAVVSLIFVGCGGSASRGPKGPDDVAGQGGGGGEGGGAAEGGGGTSGGEGGAPGTIPEPHVAAPEQHKQLLDNEWVRVYEEKNPSGTKVAMHRHPDHVAYVMAGSVLQVTTSDGKEETRDLKSGQSFFFPAEAHRIENTGKNLAVVILVELKKRGTAAPAGPVTAAAASKIYREAFDHERVRIIEATFSPGSKVKATNHPDAVFYATTEGKLKMTTAEGTKPVDVQSGMTMFMPAGTFAAQNLGKTQVRIVMFELKP